MSLKARSDLSQRKRNLTFATDKSLCYWYCDKLSGEGGEKVDIVTGKAKDTPVYEQDETWSDCTGRGRSTDCANPAASNGLTVWFFICAFVIWAKTEMASGKWQVADCNSLREVGGRLTAAECEDRTSGNSRTCPLLWQDKEKAAWPERTFINFTQST